MAGNMGIASTLWYMCDGAHSEGGTNTHTWFSVVWHQSPSVGEIGNHRTIKSIRTKVGICKKKRDEEKKGKQKKEWKKERKERERKRGYIKKEAVRKEGSESELASCTHVKGYLVHALRLWQYTLAEKHFATWLHPTLLSRACKALL